MALPDLIQMDRAGGVYYAAPECIIAAIRVTVSKENVQPESLELLGTVRSFGLPVFCKDLNGLWEFNHFHTNGVVYSDPNGLLAEYSQYLELQKNMEYALRCSLVLKELDNLVDESGRLKLEKLPEDQRQVIVELRKRLSQRQ